MPPFDIDASLAATLVAFCIATGAVAGLLAGLLGVGGGIVVVPALYFVLGHLGIEEAVRMQVAVATSLATIVPTSILSARAHRQRGSVDAVLLRVWALPALGGAIFGTLFAASVKGTLLAGIFGAIEVHIQNRATRHVLHPCPSWLRLAPKLDRGHLARGLQRVDAQAGHDLGEEERALLRHDLAGLGYFADVCHGGRVHEEEHLPFAAT
jgi:hypothetical protein